MIDVAQARVVVGMAAVGDDLAGADDQLAGMSGLVAADLAPRRVGHVIGQRDEVEPGTTLGERAERVVERLGHRGVPQRRVLGVDVEVARVPPRLPAGRRRRRRAPGRMAPPPTTGRSRCRSRRATRRARRSLPRPVRRPRPPQAPRPTPRSGSGRGESRGSCGPGGAAADSRDSQPRSRIRCATASRPGGWSLPSRGTAARPTARPAPGAIPTARGRARAGSGHSWAPPADRGSSARAPPSCRRGRRREASRSPARARCRTRP